MLFVCLFLTVKLVELHSKSDSRGSDFRVCIGKTAWREKKTHAEVCVNVKKNKSEKWGRGGGPGEG